MLALPTPAAVAAALAGWASAPGRWARLPIPAARGARGQVDIQVDGRKMVSGSHRRFLLTF